MYNLRSAKKNTIELPIEIQLTGNKTFIETALKNEFIVSDIENSMSDSDVSVSDLDCSTLINDSKEVSSPVNNSAGSSQTASNYNSDNSDSNIQQLINARIWNNWINLVNGLIELKTKNVKRRMINQKSKILQANLENRRKLRQKFSNLFKNYILPHQINIPQWQMKRYCN